MKGSVIRITIFLYSIRLFLALLQGLASKKIPD